MIRSSSKPIGVDRVNKWRRKVVDQRRENCKKKALACCWHNNNLVLDVKNMKPEKFAKTAENAGIDPSTMKMKNW